eukprot:gene9059-6357_t
MDKFTKVRNIGKGNMGVCALARNNEDGKYYVIKQVDLTEMRNLVPRILVKDPARRIRLAEVLELPFIHRRLVDWLSGDILPKKYIDTLINQNFLPESVLSLTKGVEIPVAPPALSAPLDSGRSDMSTDSRKRKQLPPLQQLPPAKSETEEAAASAPAPATAPTLGFSAPLPPAESSSTTSTGNQPAEASPPDSSRPPSTTSSGHTKESHKENAVVDAGSSAPNSTRATPQRGNLQPLESPRPARSPAMYRYFKAPGLQPVSSRNQIQVNSDRSPRLLGQANILQHMNCYSRGMYQRDMYRNCGQNRYLSHNLPALRRQGDRGRMENGQAVSHLSSLAMREKAPSQQDVRSMLHRAGMRRKIGGIGDEPSREDRTGGWGLEYVTTPNRVDTDSPFAGVPERKRLIEMDPEVRDFCRFSVVRMEMHVILCDLFVYVLLRMEEKWDEGTSGIADGAFIMPDVPGVSAAPNSIKFRSFTPLDDSRCVGSGAHVEDAAFRVVKKRRLDNAAASSVSLQQPLLHRLVEPFDISQRQYDTFQWLGTNFRSGDIAARFALDRLLGAPPSLGAVNKALGGLGTDEKEASLKVDIVEDLLLDGGVVALSTLVKACGSLAKHHPVRAGRIAFTLGSAVKGTLSSVPVGLWTDLCTSLAEYARNSPEEVHEDFIQLFRDILKLVREGGHTLNESTIAKLGRSILISSPHRVEVAVQLVEDELLSGINDLDPHHSNVAVISTFLSELVRLGCNEILQDTLHPEKITSGRKLSASSMIDFAGDVVKYAYAKAIQLDREAFDAILELYDREGRFYGLCILFSAMCVLSVPNTPTLRSLLRFVEVLTDFPELVSKMEVVVHGSIISFVLWLFKKYGQKLWQQEGSTADVAERCQRRILHCIGKLLHTDHQNHKPHALVELFYLVQMNRGATASPLAASHYLLFRERVESKVASESEIDRTVSAYSALPDASLLNAFLSNDLGLPVGEAAAGFNAAVPIATALKRLLTSPRMYCNILSVKTLNILGSNSTYASFFVQMMSGYAQRTGALALFPLDCFLPGSELDDGGRALAARWRHSESSWFTVLPLPLSAQLRGATVLTISMDLFRRVQAVGHTRVLFVGADKEETQLAQAAKVQPAVLLADLMTKLANQRTLRISEIRG